MADHVRRDRGGQASEDVQVRRPADVEVGEQSRAQRSGWEDGPSGRAAAQDPPEDRARPSGEADGCVSSEEGVWPGQATPPAEPGGVMANCIARSSSSRWMRSTSSSRENGLARKSSAPAT